MAAYPRILAKYWGPDWQLRSQQALIVESLLSGRDVLALLPTGEGKSLCYQLAGLSLGGLCLVVSPLIALMQDQVAALRQRQIPVVHLQARLSAWERESQLLKLLKTGGLIYASPEQLQSQALVQFFQQHPPALLVIDEAHCISQWGYDFRPAYRRLPEFIAQLPLRPVIGAFTATAPKAVAQDIAELLGLAQPEMVRGVPLQGHIHLTVRRCWTPRGKWQSLLQALRPKTLIYASSRQLTEELAERLASRLERQVLCYHAGLSAAERERALEDFGQHSEALMVATKAFGMGVDIGDIARVIHWQLPESLSAYVQEVGRAGRNRRIEASAVLLQLRAERPPAEIFAQIDSLNPELLRLVLRMLEKPQSLVSLRQRFQVADTTLNQLLLPLQAQGCLQQQGQLWQLLKQPDKQTEQEIWLGIQKLKQQRKQDLRQLKAYLSYRQCRRRFLFKAFDFEAPAQATCEACDVCGSKVSR